MTKKQDGADAHGPAGSRTGRPHGGKDAWKVDRDNGKSFDADRAARDAERNRGKGR